MTAPRTRATWTERDVLDLLQVRYGQIHGNGRRYVAAEHMRNAAGFNAYRTADLIVQDLWPSKGLEIIGHEVKVSRSDWLTELRDPEKSHAFRRYCHRWWLVVPDRNIVRDDLPEGWGLMAVRDNPLGAEVYVSRPAPRLTPEPMSRSLHAAMLRAAVVTSLRARERKIGVVPRRRLDVTGLRYEQQ